MPYLRGRVERVLHNSGTYYVLSFVVEETDGLFRDKNTKISGHLLGLARLGYGTSIQIDGEWTNHPKYGRQITAHGWTPWARTTKDIERFLAECFDLFPDRSLIKTVVDRFGMDTYSVLLETERLMEAAPTPEDADTLRTVSSNWRRARGVADLALFLRGYGLGAEVASEVFSRFGFDAIQTISDNPYSLISIDGFSFAKADRLAVQRGIHSGDSRRIAGAVLWILRDQTRQQGHLYLRRGDLITLFDNLVLKERVESFPVSELGKAIVDAVDTLAQAGHVIVDAGVGVYLPEMYRYEREASSMLSRFLSPSKELVIDLEAFLTAYEQTNQIQLSELQREAVFKLIANRVLVITGAPGTGKTTLIRTFVQLFKSLGTKFLLMAPTGIAAKRLASVTEVEAQTVHRALKYDGFTWGKSSADKLETQAIIVDECSMVDQELFYRLLDALNPTTMLVIVGDDAQLPSVGPGNVLRELLACPAITHIRLSHIFRQAQTSDIVLAAHRIRRGESPLAMQSKPETEFKFVKVLDDSKIAELIVEMAAKLKARDANFQVLSPKYDGVVGVDNLNQLLRDRLNPSTGQSGWKFGSLDVRVGDRIMVIKNNYKLNVYNGDIGKLVSVGRDSLTLRIHGVARMPDTQVDIPKEIAPNMLKLAYAVTVHRCQGEEFETVILPIVRTYGRMLQRNLFYTGVTRARKKVWLLGDPEAVGKAVANDKVVQRNTVLRNLVVP